MIWNIVDHRTRKYRWRTVNAVIEGTTGDNSCEDADQLDDDGGATMYSERRDILLHDAILWAEAAEGKVTLYLYDKGDGIRG